MKNIEKAKQQSEIHICLYILFISVYVRVLVSEICAAHTVRGYTPHGIRSLCRTYFNHSRIQRSLGMRTYPKHNTIQLTVKLDNRSVFVWFADRQNLSFFSILKEFTVCKFF